MKYLQLINWQRALEKVDTKRKDVDEVKKRLPISFLIAEFRC